MEANVLYIILGWLLGILSPLIVERSKRQYQVLDVKRGILTELKDHRSRLVMVSGTIAIRLGLLDRSLLNWIFKELKEYEGTEPKEELLEGLSRLVGLSDVELSALANHAKFRPGGALSLKTYSTPFLSANMNLLSLFPSDFQYRVLEIRAQIDLLNQEISETTTLFWKTFDSGMTEDNHGIITTTIRNKYQHIQDSSRRLSEKIAAAVSEYAN